MECLANFMANMRNIGAQYEKLALQYLQQRHLRLITQNYQCLHFESDLIMLDNDTLVFVEVKYRTNRNYGSALASVTTKKQRNLTKSAQFFLQQHPQYYSHPCRFDVIAIHPSILRKHKIEWVKDAFQV